MLRVIDLISAIAIAISLIVGYLCGFWTGVNYEKKRINDEIIELTTIIRKEGITKMEDK